MNSGIRKSLGNGIVLTLVFSADKFNFLTCFSIRTQAIEINNSNNCSQYGKMNEKVQKMNIRLIHKHGKLYLISDYVGSKYK